MRSACALLKMETKNRKWEYKVNTNLSYGFLKNRIVSLFFFDQAVDLEQIMEELKGLFKNHLVPQRFMGGYPYK